MASPYPVPSLKIEVNGIAIPSAPTGAKAKASAKDEVAAILKCLNLDKNFFRSRLQDTDVAIAREEPPRRMSDKDGVASPRPDEEGSPRHGGDSPSASSTRRKEALKRKENEQMLSTGGQAVDKRWANEKMQPNVNKPHSADFDVYLNEGTMPVLAQSLDALCRQLHRMEEQGDNLDPKVRARFNPLTFLAQQLLRRHPKCARTPRRQALYKDFSEWADYERGRRELLRRKNIIKDTFDGFKLSSCGDGVQMDTLKSVVESVDDIMVLDGELKASRALFMGMGLPHAIALEEASPAAPTPQVGGWANVRGASMGLATVAGGKKRVTKKQLFQGDTWTWDLFWERFSSAIKKLEIIRCSSIQRGAAKIQAQIKERQDREETVRRDAELQKQHEAEVQQLAEQYAGQYKALQADLNIRAILDTNKILTGDDVRPSDAGYELEVPPRGRHCALLAKLMLLLGFQDISIADALEDGSIDLDNRWWTGELADVWSNLQELFGIELADGVVEKECLAQVLVEPSQFRSMLSQVQDVQERLAQENDIDDAGKGRRRFTAGVVLTAKPSFETLCQRLGMTMARLQWLHNLFEGFLNPEREGSKKSMASEDDEDEDEEEWLTCGYPDNPASLLKPQFRTLLMEVKPDITDAEFDARFQRIDEDGSGEIEFDEFVVWVRADEVRVVGTSDEKHSFEELAAFNNQKPELITYLYNCFVDGLPDGEKDNYPSDPFSMSKADVHSLVGFLMPNVSNEEFEENFRLVDISEKGCVAFDEFLDVIVLDDLPQELLADAGVA